MTQSHIQQPEPSLAEREGRRIGVHICHCCVVHGCKYGDDDCPVVVRSHVQQYACEECVTFPSLYTPTELTAQLKKQMDDVLQAYVAMQGRPDFPDTLAMETWMQIIAHFQRTGSIDPDHE